MVRTVALALLATSVALVGARPAAAASTATVKNTTAIIGPSTGSANPYPSTINVSGLGTSLLGMKVVLRNVDHTCTKDFDILLVGPDGTKTTLMSDNGAPAIEFTGCTDLKKDSITFDDACPDFANSMPSGADICVRPSDNDALGHQGDSWPGVGDSYPALNLSTFNGKNPNGAWKLYVVDDANDDKGNINGGWELQLNTSNSPPQAQPMVLTAHKGEATPVALTGTDPDGDPLVCVVPATTTQGKGVLAGSGCSRTYTAAARATGTDSFAFRVRDDNAAESPNATVVFNITNRAPTATDQTITIGRNERVALTLGGTDPDPGEGVALSCSPTLGNTTLGKVSGSGCNVFYTANNTNGADSFSFIVQDGFGGVETGTVSITVGDPVLPGCTPADSRNARYVCRVYLDLLNRTAESGGKAYWLGRLDKGESRVKIIRTYQTTPEYRRTVINDIYKTFLNRKADSAGISYWSGRLLKGANPDQIRSLVIGSSEYLTRAGGTSQGFAAALYQQVLRRPATTPEINAVVAKINGGTSRASIGAALLASEAGDTVTVAGIYEHYLRRTPPDAETGYWVSQLQKGVTELKLVEAIVASNEYYNRA